MNKFMQQGKSKTVTGSILNPEGGGLRLVLSVFNMAGTLEGNPVLPLFEKKWKKVKEDVKGFYTTKTNEYKLGLVNTTAVQSDVWVLHMLCLNDKLELDAAGLSTCLKEVLRVAKDEKASVHVSSLLVELYTSLGVALKESLLSNGVNVTTYVEKT